MNVLAMSASRSENATKYSKAKALRSPPLNVFASDGRDGFLRLSYLYLNCRYVWRLQELRRSN